MLLEDNDPLFKIIVADPNASLSPAAKIPAFTVILDEKLPSLLLVTDNVPFPFLVKL